jgi:AcrR family transcriptional regulator
MTDPSTKDRILDTAEALFAEHGFSGTSLRQLTQEAGVNLAAVHYHFGSKEELAHAVIRRRFDPINEERLALLDELEKRGEPTLEEVLRAFAGPFLRFRAREEGALANLMRLMLRLATAKEDFANEHRKIFQRIAERFLPALAATLPELDRETLFWRLNFTISVMAMSHSDPERLRVISGGKCDPSDTDRALDQMVSFLAGGLRADPPVPHSEAKS